MSANETPCPFYIIPQLANKSRRSHRTETGDLKRNP